MTGEGRGEGGVYKSSSDLESSSLSVITNRDSGRRPDLLGLKISGGAVGELALTDLPFTDFFSLEGVREVSCCSPFTTFLSLEGVREIVEVCCGTFSASTSSSKGSLFLVERD